MERCLCLLDGLHGGEHVVCGKYYLYMKPRGCNKYYTLYEEDKIKNKYIDCNKVAVPSWPRFSAYGDRELWMG